MPLRPTAPSLPSSSRTFSAARRLVFLGMLLGGLLLQPAAALGAYSAGPDVQITGPESVPFQWSTQRCSYLDKHGQSQRDDYHIPDLGVRAFRDAGGRKQLLLSHSSFANPENGGPDLGGARRLTGVDLGNLTVDCTQTMLSDRTFSPSSFNNREWIASPYTNDGQTVYSLVYDEYYAWEDPNPVPQCYDMSGVYVAECHYSALTLGTSTDRGNSFGRANPFLAGLPYQYKKLPGRIDDLASGYQDPSNIVRNPSDGYYYATFSTNKYPKTGQPEEGTQQPGTCVMRTQNLADPTSWRGWGNGDGNTSTPDAFDVQFVNPYPTEPQDKASHVCKPVLAPPMADSLTWNRYFQRWMVTGYKFSGPNDIDVYYSLSISPNNLSQWEAPKLLVDADMIFNCNAGDTNPILYPAALDHNSTTRNVETTGQSFYLYFTRFNQASCDSQSHRWTFPPRVPGVPPGNLDRDLVRVPVKFTRKPAGDRLATLEQGTLTGNESAYDSTSSPWIALATWTTPAFPGYGEGTPNYAQATTWGSNSSPGYGTLNVSWGSGTDAWYGSGLYFPADFTAKNGNVDFMRWESGGGGHYGGVVLRSDDKLHLVRGTDGGSEATLGSAFDLPTGRWFWLEVHQKFSKDAAGSPISDVYLDGHLVTSSADPNTNSDTISRVNFGYVKNDPAYSYMFVDRSSVSLNERGAFGAPPTPSPFSGIEGNRIVTMWWQDSAPIGGGFRVYRQNPNGAWIERFNGQTSTFWDNYQMCNGTTYRYMVAAYDAQGRDSIVSEPLELTPRGPSGCT